MYRHSQRRQAFENEGIGQSHFPTHTDLHRRTALLLTGYILWLGGTFRLLQNNVGGILVALLVVLALGLVWRRRQRDASMLAWLKQGSPGAQIAKVEVKDERPVGETQFNIRY